MDQENKNYFKLNFLLTECQHHLSKLFQKKWMEITKSPWTNDNLSGKKFTSGVGKNLFLNSKKIQKTFLKSGKSDEWDISLLNQIFQIKDFHDKKLDSSFSKIISIRNNLAHSSSLKVKEADFKKYTQEISEFLSLFGISMDEIDKIISKDVFKEEEKKKIDSPTEEALKYKENGNNAFCKNDYLTAIDMYSKAIAIDEVSNQNRAIFYSNRSKAYFQLYDSSSDEEDLLQSIMDAKKSVFLNPLYVKAYFVLALGYEKLQKLKKAILTLEKALSLDSQNSGIKNELSRIKYLDLQQNRMEHLDHRQMPRNFEEEKEEIAKLSEKMLGKKISPNEVLNADTVEIFEKFYPGYKDVYTGDQYNYGSKELKQNFTKAAQYYSKAAEKGNAEGIFKLAKLTQSGDGVKCDYALAITLFEKAANMPAFITIHGQKTPNVGVMEAQTNLGNLYLDGVFVQKDEKKAIFWLEKAVENGSDMACNNLGLIYLHSVDQNLILSEKYLLLANERLDPNAPNNLCFLYMAKEEPEKALKWHEISLKNNYYLSITRDAEIRQQIQSLQEIKLEKQKAAKKRKKDKKNKNKKKENLEENFEEKKIQRIDFENSSFYKQIIKEYNEKKPELYNLYKFVLYEEPFKNSNFSPKILEKYCIEGSFTAQAIAITVFWLIHGLFDLSKGIIYDETIYKLDRAITIEHSVIYKVIPPFQLLSTKITLETHLSQYLSEFSPFNQALRHCLLYFQFVSNQYHKMIDFANESSKIYPKDSRIYLWKGIALNFLDRRKEGLVEFNKALAIEPDNIEYLYHKAATLRYLKGKTNEAFKCYETFLESCPKEHRKIPECYYAMASLYLENGDKKMSKELYHKGVQSEKNQLPSYLPYESNSKKNLEQLW